LAPDQNEVAPDLSLPLGALRVQATDSPAAPDSLPLAQPLKQTSEFGLTLLGRGALPAEAQAGGKFSLPLWWQAQRNLPPNVRWQLTLENDSLRYALTEPQLLGGELYPSQNWPLETPLQHIASLDLPAEVESGSYSLNLQLTASDTAETMSLGTLQVNNRPRVFSLPEPETPLTANFEHQITLLGYDFAPATADSDPVLTLYWQAQESLARNYKVFIHLLDANQSIVGQVDREPGAGATPTASWIAAEVIADSIALPSENLGQVETVVIGLYDAQTGQRLQLLGQASHPASPNGLSLLQGVPLE
jgi:hypothetical protein